MKSPHGHCLCGKIRYSFDPSGVGWKGFCHCESCRRNCSAPVTTFFAVRDSAWRWTGAEPAVYTSSPGVRRYFCGTCGTPVAYAAEKHPGETHFYAASLDDPSDFEPEDHVHWGEPLKWLPIKDKLPKAEAGISSEAPAK